MAGISDNNHFDLLMPKGPYAGLPLATHKKSVRFSHTMGKTSRASQDHISFNNFRQDGHWWTLHLSKKLPISLELIQQFSWNNDDNVHTMIRCQLGSPAPLTCTDKPNEDPQLVGDFILSITPHEAQGEKINDRINNIHTTAFRSFPTSKVLKSSRTNRKHYFYSYKLNLDSKLSYEFIENFIVHSQNKAGRELFHYSQNNCSTHLWDCFFSIPKILNNESLEPLKELATRGKNSLDIAAKLKILGTPSYFFKNRDQWRQETLEALLRHIQRPHEPEPFERDLRVEISPKRNPFLKLLYKQKLIDNGWQPFFMGDKLLTAQVIEACSNESELQFHPKSRGLIEIFLKHKLIEPESGAYQANNIDLKKALLKEFPDGFVVKKTMDYGSNQDHFFTEQDFYQDIESEQPVTYQTCHFSTPFVGRKFGRSAVTSGEHYFFMAKIKGTRLVTTPEEESGHREYRVHSLFNQVVDRSIQSRWDEFTTQADNDRCTHFVQKFLETMPWGFSWRQGLSFDCFVNENNQMNLIEMNTNRGRSKFWSDFLRDPEVLSSYALHIEKQFGWKFEGLSGQLLKNGLANLRNHALSDLLYFKDKVSTEGYNEEFIIDTVFRKNQNSLNKILTIKDNGDITVSKYLNDVRPFAHEYKNHIKQLKTTNSAQWTKLTEWAEAIDGDAELA